MLLLIASIVMVVIYSGYMVFNTYNRKGKLTGMAGMMIAMTVGMMSSLALGFELGAIQRDLTISSIVAILFGLGVGYFIGKPISLMASLDGMLAAIMGGMMGAMLGVMIGVSYMMVLFVDIIFIFIMSIALQLTGEVKGNSQVDQVAKTKGINIPFIGGVLIVAIGVVAVGVTLIFNFQGNHSLVNQSQNLQSKVPTSSQENVGYQIKTVDVNSRGFGIENIVVKAGVPTKINFKKNTGLTCIRNVESEDLGVDVQIEKGDNFITLDNLKPGTYEFHCGMHMYFGTITVVA